MDGGRKGCEVRVVVGVVGVSSISTSWGTGEVMMARSEF